MAINYKDFMSRIKKGVKDSGTAWKNLPKNLTQKSRFKKDIKNKADKEAEKIFMKQNKDKADYRGKFPKTGPSMPREYNRESARVQKQVRKTRKKQAKDKGII
jgi:hypothetical protein